MFDIHSGSPHAIWCPVDPNDNSTFVTLYGGGLVKAGSDGVVTLGSASGAADTTGKGVPLGAIIGTNLRTPSFSTTANSEAITSENAHTSTRELVLPEGTMVQRGDKAAMVKVALITPQTIIKGSIFNAAYGTAPTVGTVSTGSTTGAGFTSSTLQPGTPVADLCSVYCRSGANKGIYRITTDTSSTVKTVGLYFPYDIAVGDTFVGVPMRTVGLSYVQTDSNAVYLNSAANPATDYWIVNVLWLDLSVAGSECVYFQFTGDHFCKARA